MSTHGVIAPASAKITPELLQQYACGPIPFVGTENAFYERYKIYAESFTNQAHLHAIVNEAKEIVSNALAT